jgi:hypothetical protein
MHANVTRDQFEVRSDIIIHLPTGAEFIPTRGSIGSVVIWTGELGRNLPTGERYSYAEVLAVVRALWMERAFPPELVPIGA